MKNIDNFIISKLIQYMKNYSFNLLKSDLNISKKTLFAVYKIVGVNILDHSRLLEGTIGEKNFIRDLNGLLKETDLKHFLDDNDDEEKYVTDDGDNYRLSSREKKLIEYKEMRKLEKGDGHEVFEESPVFQHKARFFLSRLHDITTAFEKSNPIVVPDKFQEVFQTFVLNEIEQELLQIVYIAEKCHRINTHVFHVDGGYSSEKNQYFSSGYASKKIKVQHQRIEYFTNVTSTQVRMSFHEDSKLFSTNLLESEEDPNLTQFLVDFFEGNTDKPLLDQVFEDVDLKDVFALESSQLEAKDAKNLKLILGGEKGAAILLKGIPGSGKTELAKSIAFELGVQLFILKHGRKKKDRTLPPRKMALYLIQEIYKNTKTIFLIDECEDLINTQSNFYMPYKYEDNQKSYINEYLDENKCNIIFIANHTEAVDDSTMRRFNYILTFKEINSELREKMLRNLFEKEKCSLLSNEEIHSLALNSSLNIGHYGLALKSAKSFEGNDHDKKTLFFDIIGNHSKEFLGSGIKLKKINKQYSLEGLNTDHSLVALTDSIVKKHNLMIENESDSSLNIFLSGPPGTGKTEYVKHLAEKLNKRLIIKQGSDLKNMYVGETEKRIKRAFMEAQDANAMLFFDEIDSLLFSREMARQSWEIGQVNEVLVNLENFKGIFIAASNSIERMDPASLRRFLFKVKFDYLDRLGIVHFFKHFFGEYVPKNFDTSLDLTMLKKLTPSDFNTVKRKIEFEENVKLDEIIKLLKIEMSYKGEVTRKTIGI
jgi:SpoVK/Ycf46/Vps4 family AAA+-type ATPase